ncbi:2-oxoadipate dioxygenase/decarboxylase HglS [Caenimonas soli]|uniref:2-oxoadipate dioxygenase/decarboxylase HglS n=1 Tax=Caenimonas soli TaxID=2735555 RepID=UPI001A9BA70F|nr:VOC family protein [Caenimonas soli]
MPITNDLLPHADKRVFDCADEIRARFSAAMSDMYRREVPQYGTLMSLVAEVNEAVMTRDGSGAVHRRVGVERHGAIRVGTARELHTLRKLFAVMGMQPVGYYDLSVAGVPVHSTAFRPVGAEALARNPFRIFTSLLRPEFIADAQLRATAQEILARREIFTQRALELIQLHEEEGGLTVDQANDFVAEVIETFRWHREASVSREIYQRLHEAHRLVADVVCFKGPHINHLTPRTLDIDTVQAQMSLRGITPKDVIEGPPRRRVPILLRQTSFRALEENVTFEGENPAQAGMHTARFGEIEQRGIALTRKGRTLYDALLARVRDSHSADSTAADYATRLEFTFRDFPDELETIRREGLGFFRYTLAVQGEVANELPTDLEALVGAGLVHATPITYEDFLPVSAAGIFQSNLGGTEQKSYAANAAQDEFEAGLGAAVLDEIALYEAEQAASIAAVMARLKQRIPA